MAVGVWANTAVDSKGVPVASRAVTVFTDQAGTVLAPVFTDASGSVPVAGSVVVSDGQGNLEVFAAPGSYWGRVVGQSFTFPIVVGEVAGQDSVEASARVAGDSAEATARTAAIGAQHTTDNATYVSTLGLSNGVDDTAAINAALLNPLGLPRRVTGLPGQTYKFTSLVTVGNGVTWDMAGCSAAWTGYGGVCVTNYAAVNPNRTVTDAAITLSTATLTSATAAFTAADVGRTVAVAGALTDGDALIANILTVTNGTTVTLDTNAQTTVSAASCPVYARDSNVSVAGGSWSRDATSGNTSVFKWRFVDGLSCRPSQITTLQGKFAVSVGASTRFTVEDITFATYSDGVHITGPASRGTVRKLYGSTRDDFVAITPRDYVSQADVGGSVSDIDISAVYPTANYLGNGVKVLGGKGVTCSRIGVRGVYGSVSGHVVWIGDDPGDVRCQGGLIDAVTVEGIHARGGAGGYRQVKINGTNVGRVTAKDITFDRVDNGMGGIVAVETGAFVAHLTVEDVRILSTGTITYPVQVLGTCTGLAVRGGSGMMGATSYAVVLTGAAASIARVTLAGLRYDAGSGLISSAAGSTLTALSITGCTQSAAPAWVGDLATTTAVVMTGNYFDCNNGIFAVENGAALTVTANGNRYNNRSVYIPGTGTIRSLSPEFPLDVLQAGVVVAFAGDMAFNVNGARACGVGPAVSNGTLWKGIYSGVTA